MAEELERSLLQVSEKEFREMFEIYNLTLEQVKEAREAVIDYCLKQEHLKDTVPLLMNTYAIEKILQYAKGSTELCKKKVETVLTARSLFREILFNRNIEEFEALLENGNHVVLPKLIPNELCGVTISRFNSSNIDDLTYLNFTRYMVLIEEYRVYRFIGSSERYMIDLKNLPISVLTKLNPMIAKKAIILISKVYGSRIKGIHVVNAPSFIDNLLAIFKTALKTKLMSRVCVHKTYEELHEHIPKEVLPKEYGGYEESISVIAEKWRALFSSEEGRQKIKNLEEMVSDESKRQNPVDSEEYLGIAGTFRKLEVD